MNEKSRQNFALTGANVRNMNVAPKGPVDDSMGCYIEVNC